MRTAPQTTNRLVVEPMTEDYVHWRCLHGGPLDRETIDRWPADSPFPWQHFRDRNVPLLTKLIRTYGTCAILAREGDRVVGQLRFYPKVIWNADAGGGFCLQQDAPSGPGEHLVNHEFPALAQIPNKTLAVHCLMTGCPQQKTNPYQRRGLGTRMVTTLIAWAKSMGWETIEAYAFEDLPIIYENSGSAGLAFWEKLGFTRVARYPHPDLQGQDPFVLALEKQAASLGIPPERAKDKIIMRYILNALNETRSEACG